MTDLHKAVETLLPTYLDFWKKICGMETPSSERNALNLQADFIVDFCEMRGFSVRRQQYPVAGDTLVVELQGDTKRSHVALLAHMDTVHTPGVFGTPPVYEKNGILHGPGVFDCKGGIAVCLLAMEALLLTKTSHRTVRLILNSDEENGRFIGKEGVEFIRNEARGACAAFNAEAGRADSLTVGRKGIMTAEIQISGIAGHAGNAYFQSASAVREAAHKIIELESQSNECITYNCGLLQGGSAANIVPDNCKIIVDIRFQNASQQKEATEVLNQIIQNNHVDGCRSTLQILKVRPAMECTKENLELFNIIEHMAKKLGLPPLLPKERGGGSDSAYTVEIGIPTVCSMGVVGRYEHTVREEADIHTLGERAHLLVECILNV